MHPSAMTPMHPSAMTPVHPTLTPRHYTDGAPHTGGSAYSPAAPSPYAPSPYGAPSGGYGGFGGAPAAGGSGGGVKHWKDCLVSLQTGGAGLVQAVRRCSLLIVCTVVGYSAVACRTANSCRHCTRETAAQHQDSQRTAHTAMGYVKPWPASSGALAACSWCFDLARSLTHQGIRQSAILSLQLMAHVPIAPSIAPSNRHLRI